MRKNRTKADTIKLLDQLAMLTVAAMVDNAVPSKKMLMFKSVLGIDQTLWSRMFGTPSPMIRDKGIYIFESDQITGADLYQWARNTVYSRKKTPVSEVAESTISNDDIMNAIKEQNNAIKVILGEVASIKGKLIQANKSLITALDGGKKKGIRLW